MTPSVKDINGKPYLTVMSRCHEYDGPEFVQEREELRTTLNRMIGKDRKVFANPKQVKEMIDFAKKTYKRRRGDGQGIKIHWNGSNCSHVIGRYAYNNRNRIFNGAEFDKVKKGLRCMMCNNQFLEA